MNQLSLVSFIGTRVEQVDQSLEHIVLKIKLLEHNLQINVITFLPTKYQNSKSQSKS